MVGRCPDDHYRRDLAGYFMTVNRNVQVARGRGRKMHSALNVFFFVNIVKHENSFNRDVVTRFSL